MVPYAGWEMPLQYKNGVIHEHTHVRTAAGLFDVAHMLQFTCVACRGGVVVLVHFALPGRVVEGQKIIRLLPLKNFKRNTAQRGGRQGRRVP